MLEAVDEATGEALATVGLAAEQITAVTAAPPGIVEVTTGRVLFAPSVPGWSEIDLVGHLRGHFRCAVTVENDANLAAPAAAHQRTGAGTLLAVQWGERLGAGVVIDGRLHRGADQAGEIGVIRPIGHLPDAAGDGRGPLESAIVDLARRCAAEHPGSRFARATDAGAVFAAAAEDAPIAAEIVDQVAAIFAKAIAPVVLVLSPHAIVIGGGIARAGAVLLLRLPCGPFLRRPEGS
ncbi:ROK family protein [Nonomuraea sp. NPDC000554]|uniref:ROK family protein n=1 Tax=Nonomuraea sp. NPDC000554 TaxID=3154259 RepID=UPI003330E788